MVFGMYWWYSRPAILTIKMRGPLLDLSRPIIVMPFVRRTGQLTKMVQQQAGKKSTKGHKVKTVAAPKPIAQKKGATVIKQAPKPIKNIFEKKPQKQKEPSKVQEPKKPEPVKPEPVKPEPIKSVPEEPVKAQKSEPIKENLPVSSEIVQSAEELNVNANVSQADLEEPIILGQEEFEAMQIYQSVHAEIAQHWHPPAGLHPQKSVILLATVDGKGTVTKTQLEQSSGVLVYDMAARMAVQQGKFQKELWNQQIRLHF